MSTFETAPLRDADRTEILVYILDWNRSLIESIDRVVVPCIRNHSDWNGLNAVALFEKDLKAIGIPCNYRFHQQPYDFVRLLPLELHSDRSALQGEYEGLDILRSRWIFIFLILKVGEIIRSHVEGGMSGSELTQSVIDEIEFLMLKVIHYFGSENLVERQVQIESVRGWATYFRSTAGCCDLVSGELIDPETAAERDFAEQTWRFWREPKVRDGNST